MKNYLLKMATIPALLLAGCSTLDSESLAIRDYPSEPEVSWTHRLGTEERQSFSVFDWPSRGAVVLLSVPSSQDLEPLVELVNVETGELLEFSPLSQLVKLSEASGYFFNALETKAGELVITASSSRSGRSHVFRIGKDGLSSDAHMMSLDSVFSFFHPVAFGELMIVETNDITQEITVYNSDFDVIASTGEGYKRVGYYKDGIVTLDLEFDRSAVFGFLPLRSGSSERSEVSIVGHEESNLEWIGEVGSNYLFAEQKGNGWDLLLLSQQGKIIETTSVKPDGNIYRLFDTDSIEISGDKVYVIESERGEPFVSVFNSELERESDIPLSRAARWDFNSSHVKELGLLTLIAEESFALLDTSSGEITRFQPISDPIYFGVGLGFSQDSFFLEDRGTLSSYDFDLNQNWSFRLLEEESVIRRGPNLFLLSNRENEVSLLASE